LEQVVEVLPHLLQARMLTLKAVAVANIEKLTTFPQYLLVVLLILWVKQDLLLALPIL
jgi:hypothetical protein